MAIACEGAEALAGLIEALQERWRFQAGSPRAGSAADNLIAVLPVHPVLDLRSARSVLGINDEAARLGIERLERAGVIREITKRKRDRA